MLFAVICSFTGCSILLGQSVTQENLGAIPASRASQGLGWNVNGLNQVEFAAAVAAGATHVRLDACAWSSVEVQSAPPNNVSAGYSLPAGCLTALNYSKQYGLQPTLIAGYGPPYHQILTLTLLKAASVGSKTLEVEYADGVGGDTLAKISYPNDYVLEASGDQISPRYSYEGTLISAISKTSATTANLSLASGLRGDLSAGTRLTVNEILYPSVATGNPAERSTIAYSKYVEYLANQMNDLGLSGDIELWNEPPWFEDCWDNRVDCFDIDPQLADELKGNDPNYGFVAALQNTEPIGKIRYTWAGTDKSGSADLLGSRFRQFTGATFHEPAAVVTNESFHPYGNNPEDMMWNQPCLLDDPNLSQKCNTIPANQANFVLAEVDDLLAQETSDTYGIQHVVTETGASTLYMPSNHMARYAMRQFLGFMADGFSYVEFYRLFDTSQATQTGFSFITLTDNNDSFVPLPAYTALAGLMDDLGTMNLAPVKDYPASSLPVVTEYSGTYNLDHLALVGTRKGDTSNSMLYVLYQRSVYPAACQQGDPTPCWGTLAQPTAASTVVTIPSNLKVAQVINLDTRVAVPYTQSGSSLKLFVSDDPIEVMLIPLAGATAIATKLELANIVTQTQGTTLTATALSNSPGAITYSVVSGPATISGKSVSLTSTGTVVLKASQAASGNYSAATATTSFAVTGTTPVLTFVPISPKTFGSSVVVLARSASPGAVSYLVRSGPASVSGNVVTMTGAGTVILGASQAASGKYTPATTSISFLVEPKATPLTFNSIPTVTYGTPVAVTATSLSKGAITYSIVQGPATISGNVITPTLTGEVFIQASQAADGGYAAGVGTTFFHVYPATPTLTLPTITSKGYNVSFTVNATSPSKGNIVYSILSGPARIKGSTVTTLSSAGTVVLQASQAVSGGYNVATTKTSFSVANK